MKADIFELKKNEQESFEISQQIKSLESKYTALLDEKQRCDSEYKARNDANYKTISGLKGELDDLNQVLRERNLGLQELRSDNESLKELTEVKSNEINKVKKDIALAVEEHNR